MEGKKSAMTTIMNEKQKPLLNEFLGTRVMLITFDGRTFVGNMRGFDQTCNVVLEKASERSFSEGEAPKVVELGLFIVRGDNVAVVGQIDEDREAASNWNSVKVRPYRHNECFCFLRF